MKNSGAIVLKSVRDTHTLAHMDRSSLGASIVLLPFKRVLVCSFKHPRRQIGIYTIEVNMSLTSILSLTHSC